jgi:hypothetical protein
MASKAMRFPATITTGAKELLGRSPLRISSTTVGSRWRTPEEWAMTKAASLRNDSRSCASVISSQGTPTVGNPSRSSGLGSPGATTVTDGQGEV